MGHIQRNIDELRAEMDSILTKRDGEVSGALLVAVSKRFPTSDIIEAYGTGVRDFGENTVQEFLQKYDELSPDFKDIRWHFIGHLQTNKVSKIIGKTHLIHSLDSIRLAEEIQKESAKKGLVTDVLVQVNISGEKTKFGISPDEIDIFFQKIGDMKNIFVKGLMTIAPETENSENCRHIFKNLFNLVVDKKMKLFHNVTKVHLSMGMSSDFKIALEEGATIIRVGSAIFGIRNY